MKTRYHKRAMLTILGLGAGDPAALPARNIDALRSGVPVYLRTARHPTVETGAVAEMLRALPPETVTALDDEYERGASFEETYRAIVGRVIDAARRGDLVYAVPGHPLWGESTVALLLAAAGDAAIETRVLSAPSFVDACLETLRIPVTGNLLVLDALTLSADAPNEALRTADAPLLLYQVHSAAVASETKLALMSAGYPDEYGVTVVRAAGVAGTESVRVVPLYRLDRADAGAHDHLTTVYVAPLAAGERKPGYYDLVRVMARLRNPDAGCPWDLKQSHKSLRRYVLEEAYEVADALDDLDSGAGDETALCDELGDLLLQVVFHAQLGREAGTFDEGDVCAAIVAKMIRRHPHIFGNVVADDAETVLTNWAAIKRVERGDKPAPESVLDGMPRALPALSLALETSKRAVKAGFEWADARDLLAKVDEELAELRAEMTATVPDAERVESELGDLLFTLVNVARRAGIDPEDALRRQTARFGGRFRFVEGEAARGGRGLTTLTADEWREYWQRAKENEKQP